MSNSVQNSFNGTPNDKNIWVGDTQRFLTFTLLNQPYAIPLLQVKEVIAYTETTPIPGTPSYFKGIMNLRGLIISILDFRLKLKMPKADLGSETSIIILDWGASQLGVIVDSIESVITLNKKDVSPPPDMTTPNSAHGIVGVAKIDGRLILILDVYLSLNADDVRVMKNAPLQKSA